MEIGGDGDYKDKCKQCFLKLVGVLQAEPGNATFTNRFFLFFLSSQEESVAFCPLTRLLVP